MTHDPTKMDREEDKRVADLKRNHRRGRVLRQSAAKGRNAVTIHLGIRALGLTEAGTVHELQKRLAAIEQSKAYRAANPGTIHVKDGKPLTAQGAKMLGVSWPPQEES